MSESFCIRCDEAVGEGEIARVGPVLIYGVVAKLRMHCSKCGARWRRVDITEPADK